MQTLRDFVRQTWCRIVHGHVMEKIGDSNGKTLYMCARCLKCELSTPLTDLWRPKCRRKRTVSRGFASDSSPVAQRASAS